jgi:hypothetical protein
MPNLIAITAQRKALERSNPNVCIFIKRSAKIIVVYSVDWERINKWKVFINIDA